MPHKMMNPQIAYVLHDNRLSIEAPDRGALFRYRMVESYQASRRKEVPRMNEMQAHGLLIPVGSKPFEVWIDKNNSLAELQDLVNGNVDVLSVLGNGVDLWVNEEGLINGIEPDRYQLQNEHAAGDKHEKSTKSLAEVATEARESSLVLSQDEGNHDDSGNDIGNSRPIDHEYPISH